jgi:hypothetical protein
VLYIYQTKVGNAIESKKSRLGKANCGSSPRRGEMDAEESSCRPVYTRIMREKKWTDQIHVLVGGCIRQQNAAKGGGRVDITCAAVSEQAVSNSNVQIAADTGPDSGLVKGSLAGRKCGTVS